MANCKFPAGIEHVSGTLSKKTIRTADGTVTQRVFACMRNGKQRIYFREYGPRTTSLRDSEINARRLFKQRAEMVNQLLADKICRTRKEAWDYVKAQLQEV